MITYTLTLPLVPLPAVSLWKKGCVHLAVNEVGNEEAVPTDGDEGGDKFRYFYHHLVNAKKSCIAPLMANLRYPCL